MSLQGYNARGNQWVGYLCKLFPLIETVNISPLSFKEFYIRAQTTKQLQIYSGRVKIKFFLYSP